MNTAQMLVDAAQRYHQRTGGDLCAQPGQWRIVTALYGKESVMDSAASLEEALALGGTNRLFLKVVLADKVSYEPGAAPDARLQLL